MGEIPWKYPPAVIQSLQLVTRRGGPIFWQCSYRSNSSETWVYSISVDNEGLFTCERPGMITHVRVNIGGAPLCYRRSQGMRLDGNLRVRQPPSGSAAVEPISEASLLLHT
jgi:hypothetical protein